MILHLPADFLPNRKKTVQKPKRIYFELNESISFILNQTSLFHWFCACQNYFDSIILMVGHSLHPLQKVNTLNTKKDKQYYAGSCKVMNKFVSGCNKITATTGWIEGGVTCRICLWFYNDCNTSRWHLFPFGFFFLFQIDSFWIV